MIDGYGRGVIAGGEMAHRVCLLSRSNLIPLGQDEYQRMRREGYAHLGLLCTFMNGFVSGFQNVIASAEDIGPVVQAQRGSLPSVDQEYR